MEQNSPTFSETWGAVLIMKFSDFCYVNPFRWYLRSYSKVTKYAPNFWTYFVFPHVIDLPPTSENYHDYTKARRAENVSWNCSDY